MSKGTIKTRLEETQKEINEIQRKYEDPRKRSWNREDLEIAKRRELDRENAAESIIKIIRNGNFTIQECEEILSLAQKRIKFSTPVNPLNPRQDIC